MDNEIMDNAIIAARLKEIRADNGMTLDDMGKIMGVTGATVSRYESGQVGDIKIKRIKALASLGANPAWVMGLSDKKLQYGKE